MTGSAISAPDVVTALVRGTPAQDSCVARVHLAGGRQDPIRASMELLGGSGRRPCRAQPMPRLLRLGAGAATLSVDPWKTSCPPLPMLADLQFRVCGVLVSMSPRSELPTNQLPADRGCELEAGGLNDAGGSGSTSDVGLRDGRR